MISRFLAFILVLSAALPAHGQVSVTLEIKRRLHLLYEPLLATVHIQNLTGRDLMLHDDGQPWFGFEIINTADGETVPPRNLEYQLDPLELKAGDAVKRTVDLTRLYSISELGRHRIKATIFSKELDRLFVSQPAMVDITEGKTIWQQTVGVPDTLENAGKNHTIKLIEFQDDKRYLYARVEDANEAFVFCTRRLGHMIDGTVPQMQLDTTNNLYVLQLIAPQTYILSNIGVNGEMLGQHYYNAPKIKPYLRRLADGTIQLVGAHRQEAPGKNTAVAAAPPVKLSDRPPGLPGN